MTVAWNPMSQSFDRPSLAEFLLARIADDEAALAMVDAREARESVRFQWQGQHAVTRGLAECEAKRRIIEWTRSAGRQVDEVYESEFGRSVPLERDPLPSEQVLRLLALPYADHTDYRPEWAPETAESAPTRP